MKIQLHASKELTGVLDHNPPSPHINTMRVGAEASAVAYT